MDFGETSIRNVLPDAKTIKAKWISVYNSWDGDEKGQNQA